MKHASSSGDRHATRCRYLTAWFWLDPANHFWECGRYTDGAVEYYRKHIVEEAAKEYFRKKKQDYIIRK